VKADISTLKQEHKQIMKRLQQHRLALMAGEIGHAAEILTNLREEQEAHMALEETELLPRLNSDARWAEKVYLAEHRKLRELLDRSLSELDSLPVQIHNNVLILDLLERGILFKHVLEHHFEREEMALFTEIHL